MKTHTLTLLIIALISSCNLTAQVAVNIDGSRPDSSAMLDVKSTTMGFLPPRMTSNQMFAISNPSEGLIIYNSNLKTLCWFNGTEWTYSSDYTSCGLLDYEGKIYSTVVIGFQCWIRENLATSKYNDGTEIPLVTDLSEWAGLTTPGYCWYNNDSATYASTYGAMYNWYTVNAGNPCPSDWHVPSDDEWKTLEMYLGMTQTEADLTGWRGTDEGGKLKETETTHWISPNTATNSTGFTALPGGYRIMSGQYAGLGAFGDWWSVTESSSTSAWRRHLEHDYEKVHRYGYNKHYGMSVRCLRD